jgi:hypothetical protein
MLFVDVAYSLEKLSENNANTVELLPFESDNLLKHSQDGNRISMKGGGPFCTTSEEIVK